MHAKQYMLTRQVDEHEAAHKCSNGWLNNFIRRFNLTYRRGTTACQKPPAEYQELVVDFVRYVEDMRAKENYA
ncbi:pogo transposable element with KRAB domain-like protein [Aphelenchoides avenae]|nr:pogo transposable element with KRAB domain-like protein [Aphelenchus avenae]